MSCNLPMPSCPTEFYGFSHRPFRGTPDPADYVAIDAIEQEVQRLITAAAQGDGIAVLTAAPGAGKTLVCQRLQSRLAPRFQAVLLSSSGFATRRALLQAVLFALGQPYESCSEQELRLSILNYARTLVASREGIVLIVDEAHLLNVRLLEELRCLTNHSQGGQPLIRVVLCGQLPLEDALVNPALEALNYRITCHSTLEPLSMQESAQLIAGRLKRADRPVEEIFTPEALETICRVSDGNPRCLVQLCEESLRIGAEQRQIPVDAETVRWALQGLKQLPLQWNESAIDQPGLGAAEPSGDTAANDWPEPPQALDESFPAHTQPPGDETGSAPLGWTAAVSSVELGGDCDVCVTPAVTAGWSSFEPESGWEPTGTTARNGHSNNESDNRPDDDDPVPACGPCHDAPPAAALSQSVEFPRSQDMTESDDMILPVTEAGATAAAPVFTDQQDGIDLVETSVEDLYAALDAWKEQASAAREMESFEDMLRSSAPSAKRRPRDSVQEQITEAESSADGRVDAPHADDAPRDPVERLDDVIAALSAVTAHVPGPQPGDAGWQAAGDCRSLDVLEPGGEPQWDQQRSEASSREPADGLGQPSRGHAESAHPPHRRPYARLFSRARQKQS